MQDDNLPHRLTLDTDNCENNGKPPHAVKAGFAKDILSVFSSNVFSLVANLAVVVILTRKLGPEGYGLYTAILVVPLLVVSFFQMGIRPSTINLIGAGKHSTDQIVSAVLSTLLITGLAGMFFSMVAYMAVYMDGYTPILVVLALLTIPMRLTAIYAGGVFLGKEEIKKANLMNWLTALLMLIMAVVLVWILKTGVTGALFGLMFSNMIVSGYALFLLKQNFNIKLSLRNPLIPVLIKTGVVFALSFLVIQLNFRVDIVFLQWMSTKSEVGFYSLGVAVAELLWQIPLAVSIVVMTRSANSRDQSQMNRNTSLLLRLSVLAGLALAVVVFLLAPLVIPLVFGQKYLPSVVIVQTILPGILMVIIFRILSGQLSGIGKPQVALKAFVPALAINVVFNLLLIPAYGGLGAAISSNISYFAGTLLYLVYYSKITGTPLREIFRFTAGDFKPLSEFLRTHLKKTSS